MFLKENSSYGYRFEKRAPISRISSEGNCNWVLSLIQAGNAQVAHLYQWTINCCFDGDMAHIIRRWRWYLPQKVTLFRADRVKTGCDGGAALYIKFFLVQALTQVAINSSPCVEIIIIGELNELHVVVACCVISPRVKENTVIVMYNG